MMLNESIERLVQGRVLVLDRKTSVKEAARAMHERRFGSVVVCDHDGAIVGVVTDRDLACQVVAFGQRTSTPLSDVMSTEIRTVDESATLSEVIEAMEEAGVRRVPVVRRSESGRQRCVGLITLDDLIVVQAIPPERLARIVRSQIVRRTRASHDRTHAEGRMEQTLNRFHNLVAQATGIEKGEVESFSFHLLSQLIQCLPYSDAAHLIAQLPKLLQEDLLDLPAGPNRAMTADSILDSTVNRWGVDPRKVRDILAGFWSAMREFLKSPVTDHVLERLAPEIRTLFVKA